MQDQIMTGLVDHLLCSKNKGEPTGYIAWHEWAKKKSKTHRSTKCGKCWFFHVWKKRRQNERA